MRIPIGHAILLTGLFLVFSVIATAQPQTGAPGNEVEIKIYYVFAPIAQGVTAAAERPADAPPWENASAVPSTLGILRNALSIGNTLLTMERGTVQWNGQPEPDPAVAVLIGKAAQRYTSNEIAFLFNRSVSGSDYFEARRDGAYGLKALDPMPGIGLAFRPGADGAWDLWLRLIRTWARVPLPETDLPVGKPRVDDRTASAKVSLAPDTWSGLALDLPDEGGKASGSLLVLLKPCVDGNGCGDAIPPEPPGPPPQQYSISARFVTAPKSEMDRLLASWTPCPGTKNLESIRLMLLGPEGFAVQSLIYRNGWRLLSAPRVTTLALARRELKPDDPSIAPRIAIPGLSFASTEMRRFELRDNWVWPPFNFLDSMRNYDTRVAGFIHTNAGGKPAIIMDVSTESIDASHTQVFGIGACYCVFSCEDPAYVDLPFYLNNKQKVKSKKKQDSPSPAFSACPAQGEVRFPLGRWIAVVPECETSNELSIVFIGVERVSDPPILLPRDNSEQQYQYR